MIWTNPDIKRTKERAKKDDGTAKLPEWYPIRARILQLQQQIRDHHKAHPGTMMSRIEHTHEQPSIAEPKVVHLLGTSLNPPTLAQPKAKNNPRKTPDATLEPATDISPSHHTWQTQTQEPSLESDQYFLAPPKRKYKRPAHLQPGAAHHA